MKPATQDDFNEQVDAAITRLEVSALACEIVANHTASSMWPWQKRALRNVLHSFDVPSASQPHRHEVAIRAKAMLLGWLS
jgi:hypothetical protein